MMNGSILAPLWLDTGESRGYVSQRASLKQEIPLMVGLRNSVGEFHGRPDSVREVSMKNNLRAPLGLLAGVLLISVPALRIMAVPNTTPRIW